MAASLYVMLLVALINDLAIEFTFTKFTVEPFDVVVSVNVVLIKYD